MTYSESGIPASPSVLPAFPSVIPAKAGIQGLSVCRCSRAISWRFLPVWIACLLLFPASGLANEPHESSVPAIHWSGWGAGAFDRAQIEDKLILLDLTAVWCHACHVMDETTYDDPAVVNLLNAEFIPVRVDTDQRPDIAARYKHGGWPTTSVLLPSGEILFQANVLPPDALLEALRTSDAFYRENKRDMAERTARIWERVASAQRASRQPQGRIYPEMLPSILEMMKLEYDPVSGGFRDAPKFFEPEAIELAFSRHFWHQAPEWRQMALLTLDQQLKLYDLVWGGFFRYAEEADWSHPHYEKLLSIQATNLLNYQEAYQVTGLPQYREVVEGTMRYVTQFLSGRDQRGFYASQDADVRNVERSSSEVTGSEFFALDESQRLAAGIPAVDRTILTDWNALMIKASLRVSQVLGDVQARDVALNTLRRLYKERHQSGRGLAHLVRDGHPREFGLLADQVFFADALLEAFLTTGSSHYLKQAETIIEEVIGLFEDSQGGGYFDRTPSASSLGLLKFPHKDLPVNAALSGVFSDLFYLTHNPRYREKAEHILQMMMEAGSLPVAHAGLALHRFLYYPVYIVVVGEKSDVAARRLFDRSLAMYAPGKLVRFLDPRVDSLSIGEVTFPNVTGPFAYVCTDQLCSSPIAQPDELPDRFQEMFTALTETRKPFR
ncbi:MAG: thioredoxin domain-containing protein [Nitrospira sp. SB0673_bin_12]|nr:thioredoxin domain-containing protein [Nitrospira sp. SB0673_bin_12]